jgi:hypothetical protein
MSTLVNVEVMTERPAQPLKADSYDYERLPLELRDQAMLAQGTVLTKLGGAVERVIDAGNTLRWAKATLPHGEYLPWVEQACGLKPKYAAQLVQTAEWMSNIQHAGHLEGITDTTTLFLLSADATPDDVREWVMERCAAGKPPTRKEVQERKRQAQGQPMRSLVQEAMSALKLSPEARTLAANAQHISTRQLMDDLGIEELPKGKQHQTDAATYCRNGTGWYKFPIQQPIDVPVTATRTQADLFPDAPQADEEIVPLAEAAARLGKKLASFRIGLTPSQLDKRGNPKGNGWTAYPHPTRGKCILRRVT